MRFASLLLLGSIAAMGCSKTSLDASDAGPASDDGGAGEDASTPLPACAWSASLDPADASNGACIAARAYLECRGSNGGGEGCLSNDVTQCPVNATPGVTYSACKDQCAPGEYAVGCGGPGPGPWPSPPPACRALPPGPGGGTIACCPCGVAAPLDSGATVVTRDDGGLFACGGATCDGRSEICEHVQGGAPPGVDFFACIAIPSACDGDVSCACVLPQLRGRGASDCAATGSDLTVQIQVP